MGGPVASGSKRAADEKSDRPSAIVASAIALEELLHVTDTVIAKTYVAVPAYTALAVVFIGMILPLNWAAKKYAESLGVAR